MAASLLSQCGYPPPDISHHHAAATSLSQDSRRDLTNLLGSEFTFYFPKQRRTSWVFVHGGLVSPHLEQGPARGRHSMGHPSNGEGRTRGCDTTRGRGYEDPVPQKAGQQAAEVRSARGGCERRSRPRCESTPGPAHSRSFIHERVIVREAIKELGTRPLLSRHRQDQRYGFAL